jgi:AcrR family transcriptional regulator
MDDVAKASGLGRRTIYTYFKTREELFHEVIKSEVERIINQLSTVVKLNISADKKIIRFMKTHMKTVENLVQRYRVLKVDFLKRSERIENFRLLIDSHEKECLKSILLEGTRTGVFFVDDCENTAVLTLTTLKGLERQFILDNFGKPCRETLELWQKILFRGIKASA